MWLPWLPPLPADRTIEAAHKALGNTRVFLGSWFFVMWLCLSDENTSLAASLPLSRPQCRGTLSAESHTSLTKEDKQVCGIKHLYN